MPCELSFDYDLWANLNWLHAVSKYPEPDEYRAIMAHIIFAQWTWLRRAALGSSAHISIPEHPEVATDTIFRLLSDRWQTLVATVDPQTPIDYTTSAGNPYQHTFSQIATQVLNHGTYHRGHMRALAEKAGLEFPETDFILFHRPT